MGGLLAIIIMNPPDEHNGEGSSNMVKGESLEGQEGFKN